MKLRRVYRRGSSQTRNRVGRGGYWYNGYASYLRAAGRYDYGPSYQDYDVGARLSKRKGGKDEA
jgi:formylglycine-generating enzyme required for sulfatase activity